VCFWFHWGGVTLLWWKELDENFVDNDDASLSYDDVAKENAYDAVLMRMW